MLDAYGVWLLVELLAGVAFALEAALQEAEEAGVPVSEDEEDEEGDGEEVFCGDGVVDGPGEVAADGELYPGDDAEALAIDGGLGLLAFFLHAVLGGAGEGAFYAEEGFEDGFGVGDGEAYTAEGHDERDVDDGRVPASGIELLLADEVEGGDGHGAGDEEGKVDEEHLQKALPAADDHGGHEEDAEDNHQGVADVGGEVVPGLEFGVPGGVAFEDAGEDLFAGLDEAFGPAGLLSFEGGHLDGELGGALDVLEVFELPADELGAIAEVGVFGEGVVLPATGGGDGLAAPHASGAVEVEEDACAAAATVLEDEVAVEEDGFDLGKEAVVAVEVGPAGLDHADFWLGEVMDDLHDPLARGGRSRRRRWRRTRL